MDLDTEFVGYESPGFCFFFNPLIFSVTCRRTENIRWVLKNTSMPFLSNRKGIYLTLLQILVESYFPLDHNFLP